MGPTFTTSMLAEPRETSHLYRVRTQAHGASSEIETLKRAQRCPIAVNFRELASSDRRHGCPTAREVLSGPSGVDARSMSLVLMHAATTEPALRAVGRPDQSKPELERFAVGYVAIPKAVIDAEFDTHQSDDELA